MLYLERKPAAPLNRLVRTLWYFRSPAVGYQRERILPSGCAQCLLTLSRDFLFECSEGLPSEPIAPALIVGQRSVYEIVDTSDFVDLIGILFEPAGLPIFVSDRADLFSNSSTALEQVWGRDAAKLRDHLRELSTPQQRLKSLERFLLVNLLPRLEQPRFTLHPAVEFALYHFGHSPGIAAVADVVRSTGWSHRRFSQIFREQVGFRPKEWCRICRFQRALRELQLGRELPWAELAADCGFYDQAHFANEFRSFSGIDLSTYSTKRSAQWPNHVRVD